MLNRHRRLPRPHRRWRRCCEQSSAIAGPNRLRLVDYRLRRRAVARAIVAAVRSTGGRSVAFRFAGLAAPTVGLIEIFVLMVLAFLLTRKRGIPDMAARAPDRRVAFVRRSSFSSTRFLVRSAAGLSLRRQAIVLLASIFAGAVFGHTVTPEPTEVWIWAIYNFLVFAVAPYLYFRHRYTDTELESSLNQLPERRPADLHCLGDRIRLRTKRVRRKHPQPEPASGAPRRAAQFRGLLHRDGIADDGLHLCNLASPLSQANGVDNQHGTARRACLCCDAYR